VDDVEGRDESFLIRTIDDDGVGPVNEQRILQGAPDDNLKSQLHRHAELNPFPCRVLGQLVGVDEQEHVGARDILPVEVDEVLMPLLFQQVIFFALTNPSARALEGNLLLNLVHQTVDVLAELV